MALLPVVLRQRLLAAANFGGGPFINLLAFVVQPASYLRRMSIVRGLGGSSIVWKVVAVALYSPATVKRIFGKHPENLGSRRAGTGDFVKVATTEPMSKRALKRSGTTRKAARAAIVTQAVADIRVKHPDAKIVVKTK
jgi:hypothetical protein